MISGASVSSVLRACVMVGLVFMKSLLVTGSQPDPHSLSQQFLRPFSPCSWKVTWGSPLTFLIFHFHIWTWEVLPKKISKAPPVLRGWTPRCTGQFLCSFPGAGRLSQIQLTCPRGLSPSEVIEKGRRANGQFGGLWWRPQKWDCCKNARCVADWPRLSIRGKMGK